MAGAANDFDISLLLARHATLEAVHGDGDAGYFLSGWQSRNPWISEITSQVDLEAQNIDPSNYVYIEDDAKLRDLYSDLHDHVDGVRPLDVFCGGGSSSLIFSIIAWLCRNGVTEVYYIPPLYYSIHFALKMFGIHARPIAGRHGYESNFSINLPETAGVLILSDPIWYAGRYLPRDTIEVIAHWQRHTGAYVVVDGSFQYMKWGDASRAEQTAILDGNRTLRIVCPTKSLSAHGYRFAYALIPSAIRTDFGHTYTNMYGSTSLDSYLFAKAACSHLESGSISAKIMGLAQNRHRILRDEGAINAPWQPDSGFFVFEELHASIPEGCLLMDGSYFEQTRFESYRRINLLSSSISMISNKL